MKTRHVVMMAVYVLSFVVLYMDLHVWRPG